MMSSMAWWVMTVLSVVMSQIKSDEVVVFYPTCAHLDEGGKTWTVPIHGVIYEPEQDSIRRSLAMASLRRAVGVEGSTPEAATFERRMRLFLVDNERGKDISIRVTDEAADGPRFRRALEGIERQRWELFHRPEQLEGLLGRLSRSQEAAG